MVELNIEERRQATARLKDQLERVIGESPRGLTVAEMDKCWREAKEYWLPEWEASRRIKAGGRAKNGGAS